MHEKQLRHLLNQAELRAYHLAGLVARERLLRVMLVVNLQHRRPLAPLPPPLQRLEPPK